MCCTLNCSTFMFHFHHSSTATAGHFLFAQSPKRVVCTSSTNSFFISRNIYIYILPNRVCVQPLLQQEQPTSKGKHNKMYTSFKHSTTGADVEHFVYSRLALTTLHLPAINRSLPRTQHSVHFFSLALPHTTMHYRTRTLHSFILLSITASCSEHTVHPLKTWVFTAH